MHSFKSRFSYLELLTKRTIVFAPKAEIQGAWGQFWVPAYAGTTTLIRGVLVCQSSEWPVLACKHFVRCSYICPK